MASFGQSEISTMISSKKYRVKSVDTLSALADKFQNSFPSAKCMNKSSLMDKIYNMNKSAFGKTKDDLYAGKDLDLKFMCDCRCHLKIDKSKKEYVFNDEDRLIFAFKGQLSFWDDFCRCDRETGEYMKQTFRTMPGSSLPKSMPMPIKPTSSGSSGNRKLMEEVKRNLSGNMVTTNQIAEQFYKMMGVSSGSSQITNLAVQLEKENGACRHSSSTPCMVPRDKLEQVSAKSFVNAYSTIPLGNNQLTNMEKGYYFITTLDKNMFSEDKNIFWNRLIKVSGLSDSEFHKFREKFGYSKDRLEGNTIFFPSKKGLSRIDLSFGSGADQNAMKDKGKEISKEMALHANYLGANIRKLVITSTQRTEIRQAELMIPYLKDPKKDLYPTVRSWLYKDKQSDDNTYYEQWRKGIITESEFENIAEKLALKHVKANRSDYKHVSDEEGKVFDIGPNDGSHSGNDRTCYNKSITILEGNSLHGDSKLYGEGGENAYHIVLK